MARSNSLMNNKNASAAVKLSKLKHAVNLAGQGWSFMETERKCERLNIYKNFYETTNIPGLTATALMQNSIFGIDSKIELDGKLLSQFSNKFELIIKDYKELLKDSSLTANEKEDLIQLGTSISNLNEKYENRKKENEIDKDINGRFKILFSLAC